MGPLLDTRLRSRTRTAPHCGLGMALADNLAWFGTVRSEADHQLLTELIPLPRHPLGGPAARARFKSRKSEPHQSSWQLLQFTRTSGRILPWPTQARCVVPSNRYQAQMATFPMHN